MSELDNNDTFFQFETVVIRDFRILYQRFSAYAAKYDLNNSELGVLVAIVTDIKTNLTDLSDRVNVSESAVSQAITGLMKKKYIRSETDAKDRRRHFLAPTSKGEKLVVDFREHEKEILDSLEKELGDGFMPTLVKTIETAKDNGFTEFNRKK